MLDHHKTGGIVGFVGHRDMHAKLARIKPAFQRAVQDDLGLAELLISQSRQVMGMRIPSPIALLKASLAEKRVAR